jgi:arsenate reductase (glutaredoxin)
MYQIYHNPRCRISRRVLEEIKRTESVFEVKEYLKDIPSIKALKVLLVKLNLSPIQIIRQNEEIFKKKFKGKTFSDEEWLQIIHENPVLIERPIVVKNNKAVICRPPELFQEIFLQQKK